MENQNSSVELGAVLTLNLGPENSSGLPPEEELFYVFPGVVVLLSILYGSISLLTVLGNFLVILVIAKNKAMQTVTNFFIANLSVADVMIGIFSTPFQFQAALLQRWDLPHVLCPVAPFVKEMTVNVSILTLAVISIDRYFAIIHPLRPRCSRRVAAVVMSLIWIFSVASALPSAIVYRVKYIPNESGIGTRPFCFNQFPEAHIDLGQLYRLYIVAIQYFFPLVIISYAYCRIMYRIWFSKAPGSAMDSRDQMLNRNKKKVIKMLIIVVALFALCWLPLQVYNLLSEIIPEINEFKYINIIWFCSNWLAMSNPCFNPFIYGLVNERFKHGFRQLFLQCGCARTDPYKFKATFSDHHHPHSEVGGHKTSSGRAVEVRSVLNGDSGSGGGGGGGARSKRYIRSNYDSDTKGTELVTASLV